MLYWLTALSDGGDFFNLFRYITFRAGGAFLTALIFGFIFGPPLINVLRRRQGRANPFVTMAPRGIWPRRAHRRWEDCSLLARF